MILRIIIIKGGRIKKALFAVIAMTLSFVSSASSKEINYRKHIKPVFDSECKHIKGRITPEYYAFKEEHCKWLSKGQGENGYIQPFDLLYGRD